RGRPLQVRVLIGDKAVQRHRRGVDQSGHRAASVSYHRKSCPPRGSRLNLMEAARFARAPVPMSIHTAEAMEPTSATGKYRSARDDGFHARSSISAISMT